jgi:hypothetical protein
MYSHRARSAIKHTTAGLPVSIFVNNTMGACRRRFRGINKQLTSINQAKIVKLNGHPVEPGKEATTGGAKVEGKTWDAGGASSAAGADANCSFTFSRVKNTSHQTPRLSSASEKPAMNMRTPIMIAGSAAWFGLGRMGMTSKVKTPNVPCRTTNTEKTMIEMRAHSLNRNNPMLVRMPQVARSAKKSAIPTNIALKNAVELGSPGELDTGARSETRATIIPIKSMNADPSSDRMAIAVIPAERFMADSSRIWSCVIHEPPTDVSNAFRNHV